MNWLRMCGQYHSRTFPSQGELSSLPAEWQRELAALWRVESDVNNGAYLQFLGNWGRETYVYASQALKKIGAMQMAAIVDECQALVDTHLDGKRRRFMELLDSLPEEVVDRIYELSYAYMSYPDKIDELGMAYYWELVEQEAASQ